MTINDNLIIIAYQTKIGKKIYPYCDLQINIKYDFREKHIFEFSEKIKKFLKCFLFMHVDP